MKESHMRHGLLALVIALTATGFTLAADMAEFTVTDRVLRPADKVPPIGANGWGGCGAIEWAANNFVRNSGNEPPVWRNLHRIKKCGRDETTGKTWFEIDGPGTSWWDLWASGFLSGARLRVYRIVDKEGKALPLRADGNYFDLSASHHVVLVGAGQIVPEGDKNLPDGGWVADTYSVVFPNGWIRHGNLAATDASGVQNGRTYWYTVHAIGADGKESPASNEASASPAAGTNTGPQILVVGDGDKLPDLQPGKNITFTPHVHGGQAPLRWQATGLPNGLSIDPDTGCVSGKVATRPTDATVTVTVADAGGKSQSRLYVFNASKPNPVSGPLQPPADLKAQAGDGCVRLTWQASDGAVAYRLKRSTSPAARQQQRVYVTADTPGLMAWDYVVLERAFDNFDMRYVNPRVRGIGNPMDSPGWYWNGDTSKLSFSFAPHGETPAEMDEPGRRCMQVRAQAGEQSISQFVFIGTQRGGESLWYGQLDPGKTYRLEVWLRQEGLADGGKVTFSFGRGYPDIRKEFQVSSQWKKYTHEFVGPERPTETWHFGHTFTFTGPGTLWMDNCRVFRCDSPADTAKPYVPNPIVLEELLSTQPPTGRKGAHRIWFLDRDATMESILSWHANSNIAPNWRTYVEPTLRMTLPQGLTFDLATGKGPADRMRPWLVIQHIVHSEADWHALVEYLAATYDPARDTPQTKPWAYRRTVQRGTNVPWVDEFGGLVIEFGNETWHNGVFDDWIGFATRNAVHQGGREYGLFCQYLIDTIKKSPYWKQGNLDAKIRFCLGGNYDGRIQKDGRVTGYGEEAMQACPGATLLGHANYVGPKWETGDYSARTYDDHGVQECLVSFLAGPEAGEVRMGQAREALAKVRPEYDMAAYEGGPGGFALPGRADARQVETNERYGKSLAQAVGAVDGWMRSYLYGWSEQCYFSYGQGNHWNSHSVFSQGFRPSPAWLAMTIRNRWAAGDLVAVEERGVPTIRRGKADLPLVGAYAFRDAGRYCVLLVSRKLDGKHDAKDFGDGCTGVRLHLPMQKASKIELVKLDADPRLTNREKMNVTIKSQAVPADALRSGVLEVNAAAGGRAGGLPPGAIFLYVITR